MSFPFPIVAPAVPAAVNQGAVLNQIITTDGTSFTFTSISANVAFDTYPIIGVMLRSASTPDIASMTMGGLPCTQLYAQLAGTTLLAFYAAPRGATGNVVVTSSVTCVRAAACVFPLANLASSTTPADANTNASDPMVATINCPANGWIGGLAYNGSTSDNIVWSNLTEKFDVQPESVACFSGAGDVFASAQTARSITANPANAGSGQLLILMAMR
ncbi:hypothetical protein [Mesorhizobium erdmanii]|uniref:hypothetical protein n=1 Tax=Mesorhizobium erdmanii TaxID=1777866 RepID=UPI00047E3D6C|nr:hypothetical protein [Mesorhizobium erdmanii]